MPTYIKTGYWEKAVKNYKGWLDLEQLIGSTAVINSGGAISLGSGDSLPSGQVYGRFYFDTGASAFYFDDGTQWVAIGGGGGALTLQDVLINGNYSSGYDIFLSLDSGVQISATLNDSLRSSLYSSSTNQITQSYNSSINQTVSSFRSLFIQESPNFNNVFDTEFFYNAEFLNYIFCSDNSTLTLTNRYINTIIKNSFQVNSLGSILNFPETINLLIDTDFVGGYSNGVTFNGKRIGIKLNNLGINGPTYNEKIYGIYDDGNLTYLGGYSFFCGNLTGFTTDYNTISTVTSAMFSRPVNFDNSTTSSAGGASGQYLTVYVNGVQRKIALLNA